MAVQHKGDGPGAIGRVGSESAGRSRYGHQPPQPSPKFGMTLPRHDVAGVGYTGAMFHTENPL